MMVFLSHLPAQSLCPPKGPLLFHLDLPDHRCPSDIWSSRLAVQAGQWDLGVQLVDCQLCHAVNWQEVAPSISWLIRGPGPTPTPILPGRERPSFLCSGHRGSGAGTGLGLWHRAAVSAPSPLSCPMAQSSDPLSSPLQQRSLEHMAWWRRPRGPHCGWALRTDPVFCPFPASPAYFNSTPPTLLEAPGP